MPYTTNQEEFIREQESRIKSYYKSNKINLAGFETPEWFIDWYLHELYFNNNKCHYYSTSILDIRDLLNRGIITGRAVRGKGIRGNNLEIDKMMPREKYFERNC